MTLRQTLRRLARWLPLSCGKSGPEQPKREGGAFYHLSPTCQIPRLATFYEVYFGHRTDGCFVEIGAFDGEYVSNTSGLADIGWRGHYAEPVPAYAERCRLRHARNRNVTVTACAVGRTEGRCRISVGGPLSSSKEGSRENMERLPWAKGAFTGESVEVEQTTLEQFLVQRHVDPGFELLVVDVEGSEWDVLGAFDLSAWRPLMVIVELHDQNPEYAYAWPECDRLVAHLARHDYRVVFKDLSNTLYVRKDAERRACHSRR